ncbi:MAG TPA: bifunctional demethylmenaquinone methyltransferase/2-methoxy-6-polyprenyl-1,4-benzoquinol methylase UbiE [Coxiellaceae bacterium]|nr:MAG: bifunctional demethylmenaquinone methyltransferase/2-methoxy-6-polyprenyl-1,4-benzoquinol methylase [Gammaproteobacteria bacterium RIFCSPHIGHO2_12_FULL_36_30]HLB55814.1 bifunctional demethylmenaquinone methyltransferase/2-methoxy-6-polyprenyl-1,4-benzoquinol methylase UbiE [Coxiellaceae bacterium]
MKIPENSDKTHFGFTEVDVQEKAKRVAGVFHSVAQKYDVMNDLMSLGIHRLWKKLAIDLLSVHSGQFILDIAGGTGDLTAKIAEKIGKTGRVILSDINSSMLSIGRDRMIDKGLFDNISYAQLDAEKIPFADNTFDRVIIGFGLRNVTDKDAALRSMFRVLKPGGRALILEFSKPTVPGLKPIYDAYSFKILPWLGEKILNDADSYRYLAESIRMHPDQNTLKNMMENAGFEKCDVHNLSGGIVAIHRGFKL